MATATTSEPVTVTAPYTEEFVSVTDPVGATPVPDQRQRVPAGFTVPPLPEDLARIAAEAAAAAEASNNAALMGGPPGPAIIPAAPELAAVGEAVSSSELTRAREAARRAAAAEEAAAGTRANALRPQMTALQAALDAATTEGAARLAALEAGRPIIGEPPSLGLRAFLAPVAGEAPERSLNTLVNALGMFAMGASGLVAGDARAGLAALTGALQGWHEGDKERAERNFADFKAKTDTALKRFEVQRQSYMDWRDNAKLSIEQRNLGLQLEAMKYDDLVKAASLTKGNAETFWKMLETEENHAATVRAKMLETMTQMRKADEDRISRETVAKLGRESAEKIAADKLAADKTREVWERLSTDVRDQLLADPVVKARIDLGFGPTAEQIKTAKDTSEAAKLTAQREQQKEAALVPKPLPEGEIKVLAQFYEASSKIDELKRLAQSKSVNLNKVLGGIRPWYNQLAQTQKWGPMPLPAGLVKGLTPDEDRFLATAGDYAATLVNMLSGAAVTPQEFQRLLTFLPDQSIAPPTFLARVDLAGDLLKSKLETRHLLHTNAGYRSTPIKPPSLNPSAGWSIQPVP